MPFAHDHRGLPPAQAAFYLVPLAARLLHELGRAGHLLEVHGRVVGAAEPVEAPEAAGLEGLGEALALVAGGDAAILLAPALRGGSPLAGAAVEEADAAAGHLKLLVGTGENRV